MTTPLRDRLNPCIMITSCSQITFCAKGEMVVVGQATKAQIHISYLSCPITSRNHLLTACAALDKSLMSVMQTSFATWFGPEPFTALLAEMRYLDHAHRELLYLAALVASPESAYPVHHQPFSAFDDKECFAGTVLSKNYCKAVFAEWTWIHRPYFDQVMASLLGSVLKDDHTFWVCIISYQGYADSTDNWFDLQVTKQFSQLGGVSTHVAIYSMVNELEQCRSQALTLAKSLTFIEGCYGCWSCSTWP